jgi:hypothetical protein
MGIKWGRTGKGQNGKGGGQNGKTPYHVPSLEESTIKNW